MLKARLTVFSAERLTGHAKDQAYKILKHYLAVNGEMADAAITKLMI
jgi:hypothetical protein